jgi:spore maturation protein CgeB
MYQILHASKMTLNHHIGIADPYANNMRLFEATGVGTLLITDWKVNLHDMFEAGKEVVAYRSAEECVELIRYYLEHGDEREAIARAGQRRTLREHTYYQRMQELADIVERYLRLPQIATRGVIA